MGCIAKYSKNVEKCLKIVNNSKVESKGAQRLNLIQTMAKVAIWARA